MSVSLKNTTNKKYRYTETDGDIHDKTAARTDKNQKTG